MAIDFLYKLRDDTLNRAVSVIYIRPRSSFSHHFQLFTLDV